MTRILTTYLAREILKTSSATLLVLFVILVSNALGRVLADIADGDVPLQALWPVLFGQSVHLLSLLLPIALFLGIIFTFGRMYKDHEIVVMHACGIGYRDFYRPVLIVLIPFMVVSLYTSMWLNAQVLNSAKMAIEREANLHEFLLLKPGQFNLGNDGELAFFMESISEDKLELRDIIISQSGRGEMNIETAKTGRQTIDEKSGDLFLVIGPGERYEGRAGDNRIRQLSFDQHGILIEKKTRAMRHKLDGDQMTPTVLWKSDKLNLRIEFHWRIAVPVVMLVLALLAVPLAYIAPRQGRYGKVGVAILVLIAYLNLIAFTRAQLEEGSIPLALNFWWVHMLFLMLTLALIYRRNRGQLRWRVTV
jgi:lipopolysaccharide export system permease protein